MEAGGSAPGAVAGDGSRHRLIRSQGVLPLLETVRRLHTAHATLCPTGPYNRYAACQSPRRETTDSRVVAVSGLKGEIHPRDYGYVGSRHKPRFVPVPKHGARRSSVKSVTTPSAMTSPPQSTPPHRKPSGSTPCRPKAKCPAPGRAEARRQQGVRHCQPAAGGFHALFWVSGSERAP